MDLDLSNKYIEEFIVINKRLKDVLGIVFVKCLNLMFKDNFIVIVD